MELTLGSLVNEALAGWRRVPPATHGGAPIDDGTGLARSHKKSVDRMSPVRSMAEVARACGRRKAGAAVTAWMCGLDARASSRRSRPSERHTARSPD